MCVGNIFTQAYRVLFVIIIMRKLHKLTKQISCPLADLDRLLRPEKYANQLNTVVGRFILAAGSYFTT